MGVSYRVFSPLKFAYAGPVTEVWPNFQLGTAVYDGRSVLFLLITSASEEHLKRWTAVGRQRAPAKVRNPKCAAVPSHSLFLLLVAYCVYCVNRLQFRKFPNVKLAFI